MDYIVGKSPSEPKEISNMGNRPSPIFRCLTFFSAGSIFVSSGSVSAQVTFKTIYSFTGGADGSSPHAGLAQGSDGNFYGTTLSGGKPAPGSTCSVAGTKCGTAFRITPSGTLKTLVNFNFDNGQSPSADLVPGSDGNLYGTTLDGGTAYPYGGTAFRMTLGGSLTTLTTFDYRTTGQKPVAGLLPGSDGNLYGATSQGGVGNKGVVFRLTRGGVATPLASFNGANGDTPYGKLAQGSDGNLYGTTFFGGSSGVGTIYRVTLGGTLTTLVNFGGSSGNNPNSGLIKGKDGNLYGTTNQGGSSGYGTVFKMTPSGTLTTILNFNNTNGANPNGSLIQASDGNFYGTTTHGGSSINGNCRTIGCGTVFKITPSGALTTLANFNGPNGDGPNGSLVQGKDGSFYGATYAGGTSNNGTVFSLKVDASLCPSGYTLSGASWINKFPGSESTDDLVEPFKTDAINFLNALKSAGADVKISATFRPIERAYLFHYSWLIAKKGLDPRKIPEKTGVKICWAHYDKSGKFDPLLSKKSAQIMAKGYKILGQSVAPALTSLHTKGLAIDMTIAWTGTLSIKNAAGKLVNIKSFPKSGMNKDLWAVGASYGVIKFCYKRCNTTKDRPHWSINGH